MQKRDSQLIVSAGDVVGFAHRRGLERLVLGVRAKQGGAIPMGELLARIGREDETGQFAALASSGRLDIGSQVGGGTEAGDTYGTELGAGR